MNFKNVVFFALIQLIAANTVNSQNVDAQLAHADSLFLQKKYTESFQVYSQLMKDNNKVTPAMLLKMSFIKEGLGDFSSALYYLNVYYLRTHNKRALKKMEDLAEKHGLVGYDYTDFEFFMNIFYGYYLVFVLSISGLAFFIIGYMAYKRFKLREKPAFSIFYLVITIILLFYVVNFGRTYQKGIIITPNAYLMKGPSAGSGLLAVVGEGNRVQVLGHEDIWVKIRWEDQIAYIRESNLMPVSVE